VLIAQGIRYEHDYVIGTEHIFLRDAIHGQLRQMHTFTKNFAGDLINSYKRKTFASIFHFSILFIIKFNSNYNSTECAEVACSACLFIKEGSHRPITGLINMPSDSK
jgi:hypothetical protein